MEKSCMFTFRQAEKHLQNFNSYSQQKHAMKVINGYFLNMKKYL